MFPNMILRGVRTTNNAAFQLRFDQPCGNTDWCRVQRALDHQTIVSPEYRKEMVNLMRFEIYD